MKLPSFHDDYIVGYQVDCEARRIVLTIKAAESQVLSSVVFSGVAGYCFVNDALGNIVAELVQVSIGDIVTRFEAQIAESFRMSGAPGPWAADLKAAESRLEAQGVSGFMLWSSFGMSGWVLAKSAEVVLA